MSQHPNEPKDDEILPEYDFSGGVRGKHAEAFRKGVKVILLDPDISEFFVDSKAVNQALREVLENLNKQKVAF